MSLHWAHMPLCWFCHEVAQINWWSTLQQLVNGYSNLSHLPVTFSHFLVWSLTCCPVRNVYEKNTEIDKMLQLSLAMYLNDPMFLDRQVWAQIRLNDFYTVASFGHITQYHITTAFKFYDNYAIFVDVHFFFFFTITWVLQFLYYY